MTDYDNGMLDAAYEVELRALAQEGKLGPDAEEILRITGGRAKSEFCRPSNRTEHEDDWCGEAEQVHAEVERDLDSPAERLREALELTDEQAAGALLFAARVSDRMLEQQRVADLAKLIDLFFTYSDEPIYFAVLILAAIGRLPTATLPDGTRGRDLDTDGKIGEKFLSPKSGHPRTRQAVSKKICELQDEFGLPRTGGKSQAACEKYREGATGENSHHHGHRRTVVEVAADRAAKRLAKRARQRAASPTTT